MLKKKYRKIGIILWSDNYSHITALDYIKRNYTHYIGIFHDKDIKEDNTLKKAHWHILLYFPNQKLISSLKKELNLNDSDFYEIKSLVGQLRYLIHYDDEDKYQYNPNEVFGDRYFLTKFNLAIKDVSSETDEASIINEFIISSCPTLNELFEFVIDNNLYSTYRRNYIMFKDLCFSNYKIKSSRKEVK